MGGSVVDFLAHYGVKGMKWGVRRDEAVLDKLVGRRTKAVGGTKEERKQLERERNQAWKDYKNSTTRGERRADRKAALAERASYLVDKAVRNPDNTLIAINTPTSPTYKTLVTGREFVDYMSKGGVFDARTADLYEVDN